MSIGDEINSFMKWLTTMLTLNGGMLLLVIYIMARDNGCSRTMQIAFLHAGVFFTIAGGVGLFFAIITSLVPRLMRLWRRYGQG